jgi:hypothetical protein
MSGVKETPVQRQILDGLLMMGVFAWRNQRIPTPIVKHGRDSFGRHTMDFKGFRLADPHTIGMPDILALHEGKLYGIEVKRPDKSSKQSPKQIEWEEKIERNGGVYILARDWEDVHPFFLKNSRLRKNKYVHEYLD